MSIFKKIREKKWLFRLLKASCLIAYIVIFCLISYVVFLDDVNATIEDYYVQRGVDETNNIVIIGLDSEDLIAYNKDSSEIIADVVNKINGGTNGPVAISVDIDLNTISNNAYDTLLSAAQKKNNIIMPVDLSINDSYIILFYDEPVEQLTVESKILPRDDLLQYIEIGHNVKPYDSDGTVRHTVFNINDGNTQYQSIGYIAYKKYCEANNIKEKEPIHSNNETAIIKYADTSSMPVDYSCEDILNESFDLSKLDNKVVYIGYVDSSLDNGYLTPIDYEHKLHSVVIDAQIADAYIRSGFAITMPAIIQVILLVLGIIFVLYSMTKFKPFTRFTTLVIYFLVLRIGSTLLFGTGIYFYTLPHVINLVISSIISSTLVYLLNNYERRVHYERIFGRYIDVNIAQDLLSKQDKRNDKIDDVGTKNVAVLFADIRNFTTITESLEAQKLVSMLNMNLAIMSDCVEKHGGTLDKFIGDCAMAYWEEKNEGENVVHKACLAASEMQRRLKDLAKKIYADMGIDIKVGIGINYGEAIVGSIGSVKRMDYTVVGDTVNIAARLEEKAPGGEVLISGQAKEKLGSLAQTTELEEVKLKGKENFVQVFTLGTVNIEKQVEKQVVKKVREKNSYSRKAYWALIINFILFIYQFLFNLNILRTSGINIISYFTVGLSVLSCIATGILIPYDIKKIISGRSDNIKPKIVDIGLLTSLVCNLTIAVSFAIYEVIPYGLSAYLNSEWPGGIMLNLFCPMLSLTIFYVLESRRDYTILECVYSIIPLAFMQTLFGIIALITEKNEVSPYLYNMFYAFPNNIINIMAQIIGAIASAKLNKILNLNERVKRSKTSIFKKLAEILNKGNQTERNSIRYKNIILLVINIIIAVLEFRTTINSYKAGGIEIYSNPSLTGLISGVLCVVCAPFYLVGIIGCIDMKNIPIFKHISFAKTFGCLLNFFTILILAIAGEGLRIFFIPRWNADLTVFILCPVLAYFVWRDERNSYKIWQCLIAAIPYLCILPISRMAIENNNLSMQYAYEIENFYSVSSMTATIIGEIFVCTLLFVTNHIVVKLNNEEVINKARFIICGNRENIIKGNAKPSIYGHNTECYVLRNDDYAIVLNMGTGIMNAKNLLVGCKKIDILLPSKRFSSIMGFLYLNNISQNAKIRIFSTYDIKAFMEKPFWPINTIGGTWVEVTPNEKIRLTGNYSVEFFKVEDNEDYIVKITGDNSICYLGTVYTQEENLRNYAKDCEIAIISGIYAIEKKCYFAVDGNINKLIISGFEVKETDKDIDDALERAVKTFKNTSVVKEGDEFII